MSPHDLLAPLALLAFCAPLAAAFGLFLSWIAGLRPSEPTVERVTGIAFGVAFLACLGVDLLVLTGSAGRTVTLAHWVVLPTYAVDARLVLDAPAAVMMTLTTLLCGLIGVFSAPYLHRDPGFTRFFVLLPLFAAGMMAVAAGDTLDLIYAGWEVVGLASALLIAYFHTREAPVRHGLRAFAVYRVCDVALLMAAVLLHQHAPTASLGGPVHLGEAGAGIALLLVAAILGKAAAFPFTGWLPRAMEGPTPSSAVFYGALSIHAGPYLLIRAWPILEPEPVARAVLLGVAVVTAAHATMVGRVQTDAKSALGYASVTQVAVILGEIALGLTGLALVHLSGHALLRTWQLLRAPSLLHDRHQVTGLLGSHRPARGRHWEALLPLGLRRFGYRVALERWFVDDLAANRLLAAATGVLVGLDRLDRAWVGWLEGSSDPGEGR